MSDLIDDVFSGRPNPPSSSRTESASCSRGCGRHARPRKGDRPCSTSPLGYCGIIIHATGRRPRGVYDFVVSIGLGPEGGSDEDDSQDFCLRQHSGRSPLSSGTSPTCRASSCASSGASSSSGRSGQPPPAIHWPVRPVCPCGPSTSRAGGTCPPGSRTTTVTTTGRTVRTELVLASPKGCQATYSSLTLRVGAACRDRDEVIASPGADNKYLNEDIRRRRARGGTPYDCSGRDATAGGPTSRADPGDQPRQLEPGRSPIRGRRPRPIHRLLHVYGRDAWARQDQLFRASVRGRFAALGAPRPGLAGYGCCSPRGSPAPPTRFRATGRLTVPRLRRLGLPRLLAACPGRARVERVVGW